MNRNEPGVNTGTGGISILAVFVVLCLTTLATLSLVSAQADLSLAERAAQSATQYYDADARAEEKLAEIVPALTQQDWQAAVQGLNCTVEMEDSTALIGYEVPVNEIKTLQAVIQVELDASGRPTGNWTRKIWKTVVAESEEPPAGMNVML